MTDNADLETRGQQIRELVDDFHRRQRAGEAVSAESLVAAHTELMPELAAALSAPRLIAEARARAEAKCADTDEDPVADTVASGGLQIRCPHCYSCVEITPDTPFTNLTCTACGSRFSLTADELEACAAGAVTTVGHFELVERLGLGGFGTVWKARDTELDRTVAVKIPRRGQLEPAEMEQFLREARAVAQLKHPNIVSIHEVGRDGDIVYIVTDLVHGVALSDWLSGQRLTVRQAAELGRTVADALHHAHERGVVHRDVKPQNIMIDGEGQPHLMDFGLARRDAGEITMTLDGQVLGTPAYMSPEQAQGQAHRAGRGSDLYSLGVILFELLTGELPFRGNTRMLIHQVIHEEAPSPRKLNGNVPPDLETICLKCLEKEPGRRYATAAEVAQELGRFLAGEPIHARPVSMPERTWRWCRRNPAVAALAAGLTVALVTGFIGIGFQWRRAETAARRAIDNATKEGVQRRMAEKTAKDNRRLAYASDMNVALQAWRAGNIDRAKELLTRYQPDPRKEDLRGYQWYHLRWLCRRTQDTPILPHGGRVTGMDFSPDGHTLATMGYGPSLILWDVQRHQRRKTIPEPVTVADTIFSPDGRLLAWTTGPQVTGGMVVKLWDLVSGRQRAALPIGKHAIVSLAFSPDGATLAGGGLGCTVHLWDVSTQTRRDLDGHKFAIYGVAFSPDGKTLVSISLLRMILWDVKSGRKRGGLGADGGGGTCAVFSPGGKTVASGGTDGIVRLWDVSGGQPPETLDGGTRSQVCSVAYSSDGRLAAGSADGTVTVWDLKTRRQLEVLKGHTQTVWTVEFSHDNQTLASASWDGTVRLWNVATRQPPETLLAHARVKSLGFCRGGSAVVSAHSDGTISLWDVHTGEQLDRRPLHRLGIESVAVASDGETVAAVSWDDRVSVTNLNSHEPARYLDQWMPLSIAFSPDAALLAVGRSGPGLNLWETANWSQKYQRQGHTQMIRAVAFLPNGRRLATGGWDNVIKIWDVATGKVLHTLPGHHADITCLAYSPDGRTLASGASDNEVILWDAGSYQRKETLSGHTGPVNSVAFAPDGKFLASGSSDRTIRIWDMAGVLPPEILSKREPVTSVVFSPDGSILATGSGTTIRLWRTGADEKP